MPRESPPLTSSRRKSRIRRCSSIWSTQSNRLPRGLQHISMMHGSKWYGCHLGPYQTPTRESDPGHMPPNFYFSNTDYIVEKQKGKSWTWSGLRPHIVSGFSVGNPFNLICLIAVYAAISKELGLPLRFPGTPNSYARLTQATEIGLLNRAMLWAATDERCANQHFNVTNGDYYRWEQVWPRFGEFFDMDIGPVQHISLAQMMSDKGRLWDDIVEKYDLAPYKLAEIGVLALRRLPFQYVLGRSVAYDQGAVVGVPEFRGYRNHVSRCHAGISGQTGDTLRRVDVPAAVQGNCCRHGWPHMAAPHPACDAAAGWRLTVCCPSPTGRDLRSADTAESSRGCSLTRELDVKLSTLYLPGSLFSPR